MLSHRGLALGSFPPYPEFLTLGGSKEETVVGKKYKETLGMGNRFIVFKKYLLYIFPFLEPSCLLIDSESK